MIPTFFDVIQWYNQNVPQMATFITDDAIIDKFKARYDIKQDFVDLWMSSELYPGDDNYPDMSMIQFNQLIHDYESRYRANDEAFDKRLLDQYAPLLMLCLFSEYGKHYFYDDPSQWQGIPVNTPVDEKIIRYFNLWMDWEGSYYRDELDWRAPALPMWMQYRKEWRIGTKLAYVNCVLDRNWIYRGDIPEPANLLSIAPYYTLENLPLWGDLLTGSIKYHNEYSEEEMLIRHNLFVNRMAELLSYRDLWILRSSVSEAEFKRDETSSITNIEKQAAYFFLQFIIYARLIVGQKMERKFATTAPYMHEFHKSASWRYVLMKYSGSDNIRGTWIWNPGYFRRKCHAGDRSYPYLGDGVLITNMWLHINSTDRWNVSGLKMNAGGGLLNDSMIVFLRSIPLARSPALNNKFAGLINPPNPEASPVPNRNGSSAQQMAPYIDEGDLFGSTSYPSGIIWTPRVVRLADDTASNAGAILNTSNLAVQRVTKGYIMVNYQKSPYYFDMMSLPIGPTVHTSSSNWEYRIAYGLG